MRSNTELAQPADLQPTTSGAALAKSRPYQEMLFGHTVSQNVHLIHLGILLLDSNNRLATTAVPDIIAMAFYNIGFRVALSQAQ